MSCSQMRAWGPANDWRGRCVYMFVHALNAINCKLVASCHESLTKDRNMHRTCTSRISWPPYDGTQFIKLDQRKALLTCSVKKPSWPTWTLELRTQLKSQVVAVVVSSLYCRLSTCITSMQRNYANNGKTVPPSAHRVAGANELMHVCARADVCVYILATRLLAPSAST